MEMFCPLVQFLPKFDCTDICISRSKLNKKLYIYFLHSYDHKTYKINYPRIFFLAKHTNKKNVKLRKKIKLITF